MITNNQLIQTTSYFFAIAIAMALSVTVFVKDIFTLMIFRTPSTAAAEYPGIAVVVKVEVTTTQYSTIEPSLSVFSDSTFIAVSSECYNGTRTGKRNRTFPQVNRRTLSGCVLLEDRHVEGGKNHTRLNYLDKAR
ncbi:uncharacterized protein EV420DRAFT_1743475 [Desarmillaria tabescens]|uniref:Uncharacterized protein n=1 Tax=Armillaria tabescens TaxID=1929756 RepID=A0AA39NJQ8_ARMTA|nr:uncharacterized protein EV420DRAFT_1743475 [Desarmillaria tabescens]KAK0466900.1 hypothetical protein EV420DRAFT_1743475 [Desarmillaria tabescens]